MFEYRVLTGRPLTLLDQKNVKKPMLLCFEMNKCLKALYSQACAKTLRKPIKEPIKLELCLILGCVAN